MDHNSQHDRLLRLPEVIQRIGLRRTAIYDGIAAGTFPAPVRLTERAVAWPESSIDTWIASRPSAREG